MPLFLHYLNFVIPGNGVLVEITITPIANRIVVHCITKKNEAIVTTAYSSFHTKCKTLHAKAVSFRKHEAKADEYTKDSF